jgi:hypothetical protein
MQLIDDNRSLSELCNAEFDAPNQGLVTGLMHKVEEISKKRLKDLSLEEIQTALGQSMCLEVLIPYILPIVVRDPLVGGFYPGGLMHALLKTIEKPLNKGFWERQISLKLNIARIFIDNNLFKKVEVSEIDPEIKEEIKELYEKLFVPPVNG